MESSHKSSKKTAWAIVGLAVVAIAAGWWWWSHHVWRSSGPVASQAYISSAWSHPLDDAISADAQRFNELVVDVAEIDYVGDEPLATRRLIDYVSLRASHVPIGLAVHVNLTAGGGHPFDSNLQSSIAGAAVDALHDAQQSGISPTEVQIECSCAIDQLPGFAQCVQKVKNALHAPVPVIPAALPIWLDDPTFQSMARSANGFVLREDLLHGTAGSRVMTLFNADEVQRDIEQAATIGVSFRVMLPTFSVVVAYDAGGKAIGMWERGAEPQWPLDAREVAIRPMARDVAGLMSALASSHPRRLSAMIWNHFPTSDDGMLNWRWPTLEAVISGQVPHGHVKIETRQLEKTLTEIDAVNDGDDDASLDLHVAATWTEADLVDAKALPGFDVKDTGRRSETFLQSAASAWQWLPAGDRRALGWIRLTDDSAIRVEMQPPGNP